jgi:hypothetical protein
VLESLKDAMTDPASGTIEWVHTAAEIVEGVDAVLAVAAAAGGGGAIATIGEMIEGVGGGAAWPVTVGVASGVALLAVLGLPYAEIAEKIKNMSSTEGLSQGIVLGVMGEMPDFVEAHFFNNDSFPTHKYEDPDNNKLADYYYKGALALGYHYGDELSADEAPVFWKDISRPLDVGSETDPWPWMDRLPDEKAPELTRMKFCLDAAGRFVFHHVDLRE